MTTFASEKHFFFTFPGFSEAKVDVAQTGVCQKYNGASVYCLGIYLVAPHRVDTDYNGL